jgi:hypothetical protein
VARNLAKNAVKNAEALEIATAMLKEGWDKQATAKMTKLTLEEVEILEKKLQKKRKEE